MASSQPGFPDFLPGKNINIPHGYQTVLLGCPPVVPSVTHLPTVDGVPWIYPGFQGYHFIPYPNSRDMRHMSNTDLKAVYPYHQALLGRVGSLFSPYQPIAAEDHSRVVKAATRESTSPLKAWLNEHIKNPYPTKGEKIMLAIVTKMSLTQVSTWFANARRRLKKENKMSWAEKGKSDEELEEEEEEEESEEERLSQKGLCSGDEEEIDPQTIDEAGDAVDHRVSLSSGMQLMQRLNEGPKQGNDNEFVSEGKEEIDVTKSKVQCIENDRLPKPKIWSLAETATSDSQVRDSDKRGDKSTGISEITKFWSDWASRNGQLLSFTDSTKYAPMSNQVVSLNYR